MKKSNVVIIGGGPAGSTAASLIKKYSPHLNVTLLERAVFPRHHVGESLLAGSTPILKELEVYDKVDAYGFPEKLGATYVWGAEKRTWGFEFKEIDGQLQNDGITLPEEFFKGWQVVRSEYDKLLLDHSAEWGAEVIQGANVTDIRVEDQGNRGVTYVEGGIEREIQADFVLDCSGQQAFMGRRRNLRQFDPSMNNFAIYGYWKGARWKFEYAGFPNLTRILVASTPHGWIWYIPVRKDVISVGFVTHRGVDAGNKSLKERYLEEIRSCAEVSELLSSASMTRVSADQASDILTARDWSYTCERMSGDGWAMAGDAAGFVDPILSSGCLLAHEHGKKAAYTVNSMFETTNSRLHDAFWSFYEQSYRTVLGAYRQMAGFWYANNFSRDNWWWQARRVISKGNTGDLNLADRDAFMRVASGYANRTESISLFGSYTIEDARILTKHLFGAAHDSGDDLEMRDDDLVRLSPHAKLTNGLLYFRGFIRRTQRVVNQHNGQYLDLFPHERALVERLHQGMARRELIVPPEYSKRSPIELVHQLNQLRVIDQLVALR